MLGRPIFLSLCAYSYLSLAAARSPLISLPYGIFEGAKDGHLTKFLGVPFARPAARFELPQPPIRLHGIQDATTFGPACPQQALSPGIPFPVNNYSAISEACLTLDVFTPSSAHPGSKLPVLVWLYGGGWQSLGEPVIIVAPNYRLSAFGFLAGKEASDAGITNLGLRDQIFALEWVQKHIETFGGDPGRVVLGGFSAGSVSTGLLQLHNKHKTHSLFHGAFMASGVLWPSPSVADGQQDYDGLVAANNCTGSRDTLDCLRRVPFEAFLSTVNKTPDFFSFRSLSLVWGPRVDGDIIVRYPATSVIQGAFAKIPRMVGGVDDEGTLFAFSSLNVTTNIEFTDYIRSIYLPKASPNQISRVAKLYSPDPAQADTTQGSPFGTGSANQVTPEFKRIAAFEGDVALVSLRRFFFRHASRTQNIWSWLSKRGKSTPDLGAFHGSDIPMFFPPNATAATNNMAVDSIINFINTLDPNHSAASERLNSSPDLFWPKWDTPNAEASTSLLTFSDPAVINVTADNFRSESIDFLIGLHLEGATVSEWPRLSDMPVSDEAQVYLEKPF
ncbi:Carboxylic ester hydrolase [Mycena venus]|uniref:Carboxylic ester hydrolase n=1 Tax=Mycena venus TaxID=2733690 RepID=A0A8H6XGH8_9AGAR|nr:Carboxylic ester hydrolase [Mycena venus]